MTAMNIAQIADKVRAGGRVDAAEALALYREAPTPLLGQLADAIRARKHPEGIVTYIVEEPDPNGPYGAKEVGQGPLLPIMPAVANAVFDAVGVRVDEVPVTPEKIFAALLGAASSVRGSRSSI